MHLLCTRKTLPNYIHQSYLVLREYFEIDFTENYLPFQSRSFAQHAGTPPVSLTQRTEI
jgi:hypothetical protein